MIDPSVDEFFTALADNGVTVTYVLNFWDKTIDNSKNCPRVQAGEGIQQFLNDENMRNACEKARQGFSQRKRYNDTWNMFASLSIILRIASDISRSGMNRISSTDVSSG
jgi:hypothetical protein